MPNLLFHKQLTTRRRPHLYSNGKPISQCWHDTLRAFPTFSPTHHNKTYAHRLPPPFIEQTRHWANYHRHGIFSDSDSVIHGVGYVARRTLLPLSNSQLCLSSCH
ncbi:uncharacterized protein LACBIDRAFT_316331 [Laccaria bicolor S238N-H82]|uniref:Predicted protein n=1 Tax=Laccaria bicolor (strain S238N-H82 / ATCC MYA-4686) TaxID=486041 RepID=B0E0Q8_LACBS|nr:uncharacterized protein LACBIDRAFT_316331 [Laccaria bicolor S238N-H82]EDQ99572.1 predicted protein [Laccaria bicolor S238N-H82]|eukprot:XP_001889796.1 predicted protein [Laccaria bicolor S238N-H82]